MIARTTLRNHKILLCLFAGCILVLIILSATAPRHNNRTRLRFVATRRPAVENEDYGRLMNITEFKFLLKHDCPEEPVTLLIMVHSLPGNFQKRQVIRSTWGHHRMSIEIRFVVGSTREADAMERVHREHQIYGDIVQGNFIDSLHNRTYKYVSVLKYVVYHCSHVDYILKTDDDVFVNMPYFLEFLTFLNVQSIEQQSEHSNRTKTQELLMCRVNAGNIPDRNNNSIWYVPETEFKDKVYPKHCSGFWTLFTSDIVDKLYKLAQETQYFWVDNVFVTGILVKKLGLKHSQVDFDLLNHDVQQALFEGKVVKGPPKFLLSNANVDPDQIRVLWKHVQTYWPVSK